MQNFPRNKHNKHLNASGNQSGLSGTLRNGFWERVAPCPHPGVVPLGFELGDLLLLLQQLLPAGVQLLGQRRKLLSQHRERKRRGGSASHSVLQQPATMMKHNIEVGMCWRDWQELTSSTG